MFDWQELLTTGIMFAILVAIAIWQYRARRAAAHLEPKELSRAPTEGSKPLANLRDDVVAAGGALGSSLLVGLIWTAVLLGVAGGIGLIEFGVVSMTGKHNTLLLVLFSAPLVLAGLYVLFRSEVWSYRKLTALWPNQR